MTAQALEQSVLESKDKGQLIAIAEALGVKASARIKKSEIIDLILESTGAGRPAAATPASNGDGAAATISSGSQAPPTLVDEPKAEWEVDLPEDVAPATTLSELDGGSAGAGRSSRSRQRRRPRP